MLTKLNDRKILVSLETVKYFEAIPDTLVMFLNGESVVVKESLEDIERAVTAQQQKIAAASRS